MSAIEKLYEIYLRHPKVVTDSRKVEPACLFFALKGERFNGNKFAAQAIENGAAYAVIDEAECQLDERYLLVEDVLTALQELATHHRRQFSIPVLAITGSNGKTTTKELINAVLSSAYPTYCTQGNFNNHIGVPLTLLSMPFNTQIAIIEMGANHIGEIGFLCKITEPTHGLITNVGKAHLEGFGSEEGVRQGKGELYRYLAKCDGVAFVNLDEPHLPDMAKDVERKIFYKKSKAPNSDRQPFEVELAAETPFLRVRFGSDEGEPMVIQTHLIGLYNFNNLMTATVVGTYFKVPGERIRKAIEAYVPANNRSQLMTINSNTFVLDAYNANPTSMKNALHSFSKIDADRKVVVLGAMRELGDYSDAEHQKVLELASSFRFDEIVLVGSEFEKAASHADVHFFQNTETAVEWFQSQSFIDTHFLLKGSRSIGLERLIENSAATKKH